jgi:hypothetical protein
MKEREATESEISRVMATLGKRGGPARAESLSDEERKAIAQKGAAARWANHKKKAAKAVKKK